MEWRAPSLEDIPGAVRSTTACDAPTPAPRWRSSTNSPAAGAGTVGSRTTRGRWQPEGAPAVPPARIWCQTKARRVRAKHRRRV